MHGDDLSARQLVQNSWLWAAVTMPSSRSLTCAPADFFHGDNPNMAPLQRGDFTEFMAWRERHAADTTLPDAERVR